ncbi:MAG: twin-arginine translocase TatA/TatE family subunit [Akkermansia sp.]|nr:twin-arginine translocase TatA/TatE family subunit [Akkermansia sp.]
MNTLAILSSPLQWGILILVCLLVFGAKRLPDIARALGRSLGEFGKARREFEDALNNSAAGEKKAEDAPEEKKDDESKPAA